VSAPLAYPAAAEIIRRVREAARQLAHETPPGTRAAA
jgi:hypothetical protein